MRYSMFNFSVDVPGGVVLQPDNGRTQQFDAVFPQLLG